MIRAVFLRTSCLLLLLSIVACAPRVEPAGPSIQSPAMAAQSFVMADAAVLPFQRWGNELAPPKAILLALHGFNDYSNAYDAPAKYWAAQGIMTYAYDQRGFGQAPNRGLWPGSETLRRDLTEIVTLLRHRHPGIPLVLIGESMGGAVCLTALTSDDPPDVDRTILSAPAVWGKQVLPLYMKAPFWFFAHTIPWLEVRPRVDIQPSDNIEMLRALGRDPLIIKRTRIDAAWGLLNLMTDAHDAGARLDKPTLILFGLKEELIPEQARQGFLAKLPASNGKSWALREYEDGYHMLMRDLNAEPVWQDIADFILDDTVQSSFADGS
ncbi:alpha/beta hydrolase [Aestuariispira insulae]|uniref:Alpha-beta hydrolase superfamily lysophospholipase n=1 Tax=Aestuariispira insulae TaxID=1461337 RepID=A0A3D9HAW3_9PROT|nr:alpha/beta hydrolase [Aestuariispira insulae]RED46126.1 alpha-beta hydrolase superfamily lysophospholipase [Aestuariispira insulae]